jgi:hypothetical protein
MTREWQTSSVAIIDAREIAECASEDARWRLIAIVAAEISGSASAQFSEVDCRPRGKDFCMRVVRYSEGNSHAR